MSWTPEQLQEVQERLARNRQHAPHVACQKATDAQIVEAYAKTGSIWKTGELLGMCGQSVWDRLKRGGVSAKPPEFTIEQKSLILDFYSKGFQRGDLQKMCDNQNMLITSVSRWARKHGLTDLERTASPETCALNSKAMQSYLAKHEHPKGMLGKKHTKETLALVSAASTAAAKVRTPEQEAARMLKGNKTKAKNGTLLNTNHIKTTWKQGWYDIGKRHLYMRSGWEANYARYLELLIKIGDVSAWEFEPETFWFENIKRGTNNYTPDFKVTLADGSIEFHEIKGWMDSRSKTKIRRMKKYHPKIKLVVRDTAWFKEHRALKDQVPGWGMPPASRNEAKH